MKKILLLVLVLMMCGCSVRRDDKYYLALAETSINFFRSDQFDESKIHEDDLEAVKEFLSTITHVNQRVNISELESISETRTSYEANSPLVTVEDGMCYIDYSILEEKFQEFYKTNQFSEIDAYYTVSCNGKYITLYEDMFYPAYEETKENPRYDYVLYDYFKEDGNYYYIYRSSYDGTGLRLSLIRDKKKLVKIETSPENIEWTEN